MGNCCSRIEEERIILRKLHRGIKTPTRATGLAAGLDLYSPNDYCIPARGKLLIPTGLYVQLPDDSYGRIAPKSGLAYRQSLHVGAGVLDCDHQGEVQVLLFNFSAHPYQVRRHEPIAQLIVERIYRPPIYLVHQFTRSSARGTYGFGSGVMEFHSM